MNMAMMALLRGRAAALLLAVAALLVGAAATAAEPVGRVLLARGAVSAELQDGSARMLRRRDSVHESEVLVTGPDSRLQVRFDDGAMLELRADSRVDLALYRYGRAAEGRDAVLLKVLGGGVRAITGAIGHGDPAAYEMQTPVASIGVRGTHFTAVQDGETAWVFGVWEGGIRVANELGGIDLGRDADFLFARAEAGAAPVGLVQAPGALGEAAAGGSAAAVAPQAAAAAGAAVPAETTVAASSATSAVGGAAPGADEGAAGGGVVAMEAVRISPAEGVDDAADLAELRDGLLATQLPLSAAERAALATGAEQGILLVADGQVLRGLAATGDDGGPLVLVDLEDGSTALFRGLDGAAVDGQSNVAGFDVSWGTFMAGAGAGVAQGARLFVDAGGVVTERGIDGDLTLLQVESARPADLNVTASYAGSDVIGTTSAGEITSFGLFFDAALDLGSGRIRDGHLLLEAGGGLEEYRVNFEGLVAEGRADLDVTRGTITGSAIDGVLDVDRDLSVLRGLFTAAGEGFAGGFTLQEAGNAGRFARGGFVAEKLGETTPESTD